LTAAAVLLDEIDTHLKQAFSTVLLKQIHTRIYSR